MKHLLLLPLVLFVLMACKKNNNDTATVDDGKKLPKDISALEGQWKSHSHFYSQGGPLIWEDTDGSVMISFNKEGVYSNNKNATYNGFELSRFNQDTILSLYTQGKTDTVFFAVSIFENTLTLANIRPGCIEGCGDKYVRVQQ